MNNGSAQEYQPWVELRIMRTRDGHNLTSLAQAAGISLGYLSDLENGKREPNPRVIHKLSRTLNVPISMLEKRCSGEWAA